VSLASVPLADIESASTEATQLVPLQKQIERMTKRVQTRMFGAQSSAWGGSSKLYAVLKRLSKDDGELATGLEPVEQYFNHRHPLVAKNHPKTKEGKARLKEEKAGAGETGGTASTVPASVVEAPPAPGAGSEGSVVTPASNGTATNGAAANGVAHS